MGKSETLKDNKEMDQMSTVFLNFFGPQCFVPASGALLWESERWGAQAFEHDLQSDLNRQGTQVPFEFCPSEAMWASIGVVLSHCPVGLCCWNVPRTLLWAHCTIRSAST